MKGFYKVKVELMCGDGFGGTKTVPIDGFGRGLLAIHKPMSSLLPNQKPTPYRYVTHIPTGLTVAQARTMKAAKLALEKLLDVRDWDYSLWRQRHLTGEQLMRTGYGYAQ
jgi:hypothetical protein